MADGRRERFHRLHEDGIFVMPNAWDPGSARLLTATGCAALATTSAGFAWTLGVEDYRVTRDQLVEHVAAMAAATELPLSVDGERLFGTTAGEVAATVDLLAEAGAAGCSIEDFDSAGGDVDDAAHSAELVGAAAEAAHRAGMVLTARAENLLHGRDDLDDTIARRRAYRAAGADVVYAPGLRVAAAIRSVVEAVGCPVNVLMLPGVPPVVELGALGVRRVSTGSILASRAYAAGLAAARSLLEQGGYGDGEMLSPADRAALS
ncbi:MAG TPA: isocitrate lyase/phosphoenolpyruvate mutase family protein [Gaiellales bacterium]|nr:isocitrate lyase/phosphoenolpyruvate mutase family protein [Gaiellales bacterium]